MTVYVIIMISQSMIFFFFKQYMAEMGFHRFRHVNVISYWNSACKCFDVTSCCDRRRWIICSVLCCFLALCYMCVFGCCFGVCLIYLVCTWLLCVLGVWFGLHHFSPDTVTRSDILPSHQPLLPPHGAKYPLRAPWRGKEKPRELLACYQGQWERKQTWEGLGFSWGAPHDRK